MAVQKSSKETGQSLCLEYFTLLFSDMLCINQPLSLAPFMSVLIN